MLPFRENQRNFPNEPSRNGPGQGLLNTPNVAPLHMRRGRGSHGINSRMPQGSFTRNDMNAAILGDGPMQALQRNNNFPQGNFPLVEMDPGRGGPEGMKPTSNRNDDGGLMMGMNIMLRGRGNLNTVRGGGRGDMNSFRGGRGLMMNPMQALRGNLHQGGRGGRPLLDRGRDPSPRERSNQPPDAPGRNNRFMDDDDGDRRMERNMNRGGDFMQSPEGFAKRGHGRSRDDFHEMNQEFRRPGPSGDSGPSSRDMLEERNSGGQFENRHDIRNRGGPHRELRHSERDQRQMENDNRSFDRERQRFEDGRLGIGGEPRLSDRGPHQHDKNRERGPQQFQRGRERFDEDSPAVERGLQDVERGPQPFERSLPHPLERGQPHPFERGQPHPFERGQPHPFERGQPQPFERGEPHPFERSQPQPFGRGQPHNFERGQPPLFGRGQPHNFERGQVQLFDERGRPQIGRGPQQMDNEPMPFEGGPQRLERDMPPFGRGGQRLERQPQRPEHEQQPYIHPHPSEMEPEMQSQLGQLFRNFERDQMERNSEQFEDRCHPGDRDRFREMRARRNEEGPPMSEQGPPLFDRRFPPMNRRPNDGQFPGFEDVPNEVHGRNVHEFDPHDSAGGLSDRNLPPQRVALMPPPINLQQEESVDAPMKGLSLGQGRGVLPPPESVSGRKTLLSMPPTSQSKEGPAPMRKGILPAPDAVANSAVTSQAATAGGSSAPLLPPPYADISRPPPGFDEKGKDQSEKEEAKSQSVCLPHPSSILPPPEAVSAMKEKKDSELAAQEVTTAPSVALPPPAGLGDAPPVAAVPASTPAVPLHLPPPQVMGYPSADAVMNTSFPPPAGFTLPPPADLSVPPPAAAANLSVPPPPSHDLSVPPPMVQGHLSVPPLHLPPPGYDSKPDGENKEAAADLGDEEYLRELSEWHKQIETYESQMADYFQKCRDRLMEIYPSDPNTADEATRSAYQTEYEKLQQEYQNFVEYMQPMREYYAEATAQMAKEERQQTATAAPAAPTNDISLAPPPPMPEQEPPPPPPPPNEAAPPAEPPADLTSNSLKQLAEDYGGGEAEVDGDIPAATYYSQYYRQMIDYYQQLLKSMQGDDANNSSSGDSSDEEMRNLNKNQRKKLRKKKKLKKKQKEEGVAAKTATQPPPPAQQQQPPPPPQAEYPGGGQGAGAWGEWGGWYGGYSPWSAPPPDLSMLGTGMEWQEVVSRPPPAPGKPSVIQQQVALTNKQLMDHPTVADGVAGYGANIPAPPKDRMTLEAAEGMNSVGVGADVAGGANTNAGLQPHMSAVMAHVQAMAAGAPMVPPPPPLAQAQPGSIFAEESKEEASGDPSAAHADNNEDDEDEGDWSYCPTCSQKFTSERAYTVHLRGVKHMQNALEKAQKKDPDKFKEEREAELVAVKKEEDPEKKHLEWMIQQSVKRRGLGSMGSFFCELCNVECTSEKALAMHLNGTKHALRVDQLKSGQATLSSLQTVEDKRIVRKRAQLRIQTVLDQCLEALIGLNYITEYQREDTMAECRYHCQLCDFRFSPKTFMSHVSGVKHRKNFMKYNYSDMYEILDQDSSAKVVRAKRINVYSRKIEEYEGRKRVSIKTEITDEGRKKEAKRERLEKEFHEQQQAEAAAEAKAKAEAEARAKENPPPPVDDLRPAKEAAAQLEAERRRRHEERRRAAAAAAAAERRRVELERKRRLKKEGKAVRQRAKAAAAAAKARGRRSEEEDAELEEGEIASDEGDSSLTDGEIIEAQFAPSPATQRRRRGTDYDSGFPSFTEEGSSGDEFRPVDRRRAPVRPPARYEGFVGRREPVPESRDRKPEPPARVKKEAVPSKDAEEDEEEEVGLVEEEDVEYEDAYVSERPPMTFQLKEDSERDEFIRGVKERKMLRLKEVTPDAVKQFEAEAEWVLARRKKEDDAKKEAVAEEKRKRLEQLRRDEASILHQPGIGRPSLAKLGIGGRSSRLGLLLPDLGTEAGPARQQSAGLAQPGGQQLAGAQATKVGAGVPLPPPNPALQMLMRNYQAMTGLGLQPPPPPRVGGEQENPAQLAELISTMKTMMAKFEARAPPPPRANRPALLMPPPPRKPPSLVPLTKRRRLLEELLPENQETDEPSGKRPRPTPIGGGLLPLPEPPGQRRTLLGAPPTIPASRKTLLGERPPPETAPAAPTTPTAPTAPTAHATPATPTAPYNKKVLFPTGPGKTEEERGSLLATPAEESGEESDGEKKRLKSVVALPAGKVGMSEEKEGEEKTEEKVEDVAETFRAASGVKEKKKEDEGEEKMDTAGMEEGELEDDEEEDGPPPEDRFFDCYAMWRPPGPMAPPGMMPHRPPFIGGHMGFGGARRRPMDDDDHLRELMKKPDFRIHPMRRMGPGPGRPAPGPGESRNLTAIAKLLGLNEPRPQRPPPPAGGKLPDVDVNQLKAILTHVHQHQRPGSGPQSSNWRRNRSEPKPATSTSNSGGSKPNPASDKA